MTTGCGRRAGGSKQSDKLIGLDTARIGGAHETLLLHLSRYSR